MRPIGLDLSLTATGISTDDDAWTVKVKTTGMQRLHDLSEAVIRTAMPSLDYLTHVFVEGYAFARPNQAHQLGELGGVVRYRLWELGIPYTDVAPACLKKFATGKGNAGKPDMLDASRRAGYEGSNDDNAVDAWFLRQFGLYVFRTPRVERFAYRDEVVAPFLAPVVVQA